MAMRTFTYEMLWFGDDDNQGSFCSVVIAPDEATAERLVALDMLQHNECEAETLAGMLEEVGAENLEEWFEQHDVTSTWEDVGGRACPNCTNHSGRPTGFHHTLHDGRAVDIHSCDTCGYEWLPLGFGPRRKDLEAAALLLIAEADALDAGPGECGSCGEEVDLTDPDTETTHQQFRCGACGAWTDRPTKKD